MSDHGGALVVVGLPDRRTAAGFDGVRLVGRDELLNDLHYRLTVGGEGELALTAGEGAITLHGLGGIGKTALALEYCHLHGRDYSLVWWVNADSEQTILDSYRELVATYGLEVDDRDLKAGVAQVLREVPGPWLAVFDNAEDREFFKQWRPSVGGGQLLVTTRSNTNWSHSFPVGLIASAAAEQWLLRAAGQPTSEREQQAAKTLAERLDGLALALTMATAYISSGVSPSEYLGLFDSDSARLLSDRARVGHDYDHTVYTALAVTRNRLRTENAEAAVLMLEYASFYAPDRIPLELFTPESLGVESMVEVIQARLALAELSLIIVHDGTHFSVHRLIQDVTRFYLDHPPPSEEPVPAPSGVPVERDRSSVVKIVMFTANSMNSPLELETEVRTIKDVLDAAQLRDNVELELSLAATPDDLVRDVSRHDPKIVHFSGHGEGDGIQLKDGHGGHQLVSGERLRRFFEDRGVQLVVLNSCYSGDQAVEIAKVVPMVVGTPIEVGDDAAIKFSRAFYRTLGDGRTVARAYRDGQDAVSLHNLDDKFITHGDLDQTLITS